MLRASFKNSSSTYCNHWNVEIINSPDNKPIVYFYDMTQDKEKFPQGQFVTSYYVESLLKHRVGPWDEIGLNLYGECPFWSIRREDFRVICDWLSHIEQV